MNLLLTIMFFVALSGTIYFFGKLACWMVIKINPTCGLRPITNKDILGYNIIMVVSIILWSIIFYYSLK